LAKSKVPAAPFTLSISCPKCDEPARIKVRPPKSTYDFECEEDDCDFEAFVFVAVARSKRSKKVSQRVGKQTWIHHREFSIRVIDLAGRQHHLEYSLPTDTELEMKQGDTVAFFFNDSDREELLGISNSTIRTTEEVAMPAIRQGGCAILLAVGLLFAGATVAWTIS
jgi:hypothetical protein